MPQNLRVAVAGVGNCASALLQGIEHYGITEAHQSEENFGLAKPVVGGFRVSNIQIVCAFDVDHRKVGLPLSDAIFANPNNAQRFANPPRHSRSVIVERAPTLDGVAQHMLDKDDGFHLSEMPSVNVEERLLQTKAEVLILFLPVGSENAARHFAKAALAAQVALVNCIPVFLAGDENISNEFRDAGIPIIGDDVRSQLGATILHQKLIDLFHVRGLKILKTYQLNIGGNSDFHNMTSRERTASKKKSKTSAVISINSGELSPKNTNIGPSDYLPTEKDKKTAFIQVDALGFGGLPVRVDVKLEVQDSPNSAGVVIDCIRYAGSALRFGISGPLCAVSSLYMKSPPIRMDDAEAMEQLATWPISE